VGEGNILSGKRASTAEKSSSQVKNGRLNTRQKDRTQRLNKRQKKSGPGEKYKGGRNTKVGPDNFEGMLIFLRRRLTELGFGGTVGNRGKEDQ